MREIGEYLAVTGALGIDKLHEQLEVRLRQCAIRADLRVPCINIAAEPRFRVCNDWYYFHIDVTMNRSFVRCQRNGQVLLETCLFLQVSEITLGRLVSLMAGQNDALTSVELKQLTPRAIVALVADANVPFVQKVNLLNTAVQWFVFSSAYYI